MQLPPIPITLATTPSPKTTPFLFFFACTRGIYDDIAVALRACRVDIGWWKLDNLGLEDMDGIIAPIFPSFSAFLYIR